MHGMFCMCSYQTCVCVHLLSLASIAIAAMAFRSEPVKVKEVFMISGGCQSKTAEIFCIAKDELLILNDKTYFEIAASGKYRYKFASLFGQRELQVVLDDLRIKRRAATLKLSKDAGGGIFEETTALRASSHHDRQQAKRCRDLMSVGQVGSEVVLKLPAMDNSPAVSMTVVAELGLRAHMVVEMAEANLTWLAAACTHVRKIEHTNTVVWNEQHSKWIAARLEDSCMHS